MNARSESPALVSAVGLLLAGGMLAFFALGWAFRGYDPVRLVLALVPVGLGLSLAGAGAYLGLRQGRAAAIAAGRPAAAAPAQAGVRATVTVVEAQGVCPFGYAMAVGARWTIGDGLESAAGLCPQAREAVGVYLAELAGGGTPSALPSCITKRHRAVFQVARQPQEPVAVR